MHIVIGDGGNREGLADVYDEPQPEWSAYREASYGSGTLDLLNSTHALWRWHRNQDSQAVVSDEASPVNAHAALSLRSAQRAGLVELQTSSAGFLDGRYFCNVGELARLSCCWQDCLSEPGLL